MDKIKDLILYENENTRLDFKLSEYIKPEFSAFLKDILSMANAETIEPRYIIIGLKPKSTGDRGIIGIPKELTDSSTYQQLIYENIEPELSVDYQPFRFEDKILGVFKISNCIDQPYIMKKDYGDNKNKLHKGDSFIRKGTHQTRLLRSDLDIIYKTKLNPGYFNEDFLIGFKGTNYNNTIELPVIKEIELPSEKKKKKIIEILEKKRYEEEKLKKFGIDPKSILLRDSLPWNFNPFGGGKPYEDRDIETLEENLKNISQTYIEHDYYYLFEECSHKITLELINIGSQYIEDATIQIIVSKVDGLLISDKIYLEPKSNNPLEYKIDIQSSLYYPRVDEEYGEYIIRQNLRDIAHQLKVEVFSEPLRLVILPEMSGQIIEFSVKLFAKNINKAIEKSLKILVI